MIADAEPVDVRDAPVHLYRGRRVHLARDRFWTRCGRRWDATYIDRNTKPTCVVCARSA